MVGMQEKSRTYRSGFFMIGNNIVDSGVWSRMKPSERAVYIVIARFAHNDSGLAYPTIKKICELSGLSKNSVCTASRNLAKYGLIEKKLSSKRFHFRMTYRVLLDPEINFDTVPQNLEKCGLKKRGKGGKFISVPGNMETGTIPGKLESDTIPGNMEKKKTYKESIKTNYEGPKNPFKKGDFLVPYEKNKNNLHLKERLKILVDEIGFEKTKEHTLNNPIYQKALKEIEEEMLNENSKKKKGNSSKKRGKSHEGKRVSEAVNA